MSRCPGLAWLLWQVGQRTGKASGRLAGTPKFRFFLTGLEATECTLLLTSPGLGTKDGVTPFVITGLKAGGLASGVGFLILGSGASNQSGSSTFPLPLVHWPRARSTVSLAQGSGLFARSGHLWRLPGRTAGLTWTLTGLRS